KSGAEDFYTGESAVAIDQFSRKTGGALRLEDLAAHRSEWVTPIQTTYMDHQVWEMPPNNQAIAALLALNILSDLELPAHREDEYGLHLQIEAMKLAFTDTLAYVGDADHCAYSAEALLSQNYATQRRGLISDVANTPKAGMPETGNTVYMAVADSSGMMV